MLPMLSPLFPPTTSQAHALRPYETVQDESGRASQTPSLTKVIIGLLRGRTGR